MPERAADVGPILRWARRFGSLTVCRAYGEWRDPAERLAIYNAGVEVVYAPVLPLGGSLLARNGGGAKSLADTAMAVDVTDMLNLMPGLTSLVMTTSDKDLIPVLRFAQRRGLHAAVVGSDRTAGALKDLADAFISYRQLLEGEDGGAAPALSRPVTVPPLRYPRAGTGARSAAAGRALTPAETPAALPAPAPASTGRTVRGRAAGAVVTPVAPAGPGTAVAPPARQPSTAGAVFPAEATAAGVTPAEPEAAPAPGTGLGAAADQRLARPAPRRRRRRGGRRRAAARSPPARRAPRTRTRSPRPRCRRRTRTRPSTPRPSRA